jgi:3(or 17)beta-hydroxysteroid dehydrogenase
LYCAEQNLPIRCNTIFPASIRTPMWEAMMHGKDEEQALLDSMPLHRFGRPEEVAAIAVLLASDEATYVTGSEFNIDGGILAGTSTSPK